MVTDTIMADDVRSSAALYRLMAWLSPSFPVGAFSYSSGIEWAVEANDITDAETLKSWLDVMLTEGGGFCDAVLFAQAHRAVAGKDDKALRDGDGIMLDDGGIVLVTGQAEPLAEIAARTPLELVRLAWHLGNRHTDVQIVADKIRIRRDHVLEDMLRGLGAALSPVKAAFDPESPTPSHEHGHGHRHEHGNHHGG